MNRSYAGAPNATTKFGLTGYVKLTTLDGDTAQGVVDWADTVGLSMYLDFINDQPQSGRIGRFFPWQNVAFVDRAVKRDFE